MRKKLSVLVLSVFILTLLPAVSISAKKPRGTMDLEFNLLVPPISDQIPDWVGTITIDGEEYGMVFFAIGSGKAFDDDFKGNVHFFKEIWAIYDTDFDLKSLIPSDDPADWEYWLPVNEPDELALWGYDKGQTNVQNSKYRMNGNIEEAFGDFGKWTGRNVHMSGIITWQILPGDIVAPETAPGTFRIN
ncbi:MAG: hypothetical protein ACFFDC_12390 [Promethearchaeota archaeon]